MLFRTLATPRPPAILARGANDAPGLCTRTRIDLPDPGLLHCRGHRRFCFAGFRPQIFWVLCPQNPLLLGRLGLWNGTRCLFLHHTSTLCRHLLQRGGHRTCHGFSLFRPSHQCACYRVYGTDTWLATWPGPSCRSDPVCYHQRDSHGIYF